MNQSSPQSQNKKYQLVLSVLFILVYLCGFTALRLVRDDWSSISNFDRGMHNNPFGFISDVITNRWLGLNQSRIFFLSWLVQIAVGFFGRFNYVPYYLFILCWHFITSLLLFSVLRKHLQSPAIAGILSCIYLVAPANTNVLFWLNNWFFSIPVFLLVLQLYVLSFPFKRSLHQVVALSLVSICGQFAGEQAIFMFYLSFGLFSLHAFFSLKGSARSKELFRTLVPAVFTGCALIIYIKWVMDYSVTENTVQYSLESVRLYLWQFFNFLIGTLDLKNEFYGHFFLPFDRKTILLGVGEMFILVIVFAVLTSNSEWGLPRGRALIGLGVMLLYALAALFPCLYGALTGIRPGASWRYLFVPAFPIFGVCVLFCGLALSVVAKRLGRWVMFPFVIFVIYLSVLTTYTLNRVWRFQKGVDEKIWSKIDEVIKPDHNSIVTVNLSEKQPQLMAHYYSQAISDFQADWGVSQRLWPTQHKMMQIGQRVEEIEGKSDLRVIGYYTGSEWVAPRDSVLFVTYKYGPKYSDLKDAKLHVFGTYPEFMKFIESDEGKAAYAK